MSEETPLWSPSPARIASSQLRAFEDFVAQRGGLRFADYSELHRWSITSPDAFWRAVWDFAPVLHEGRIESVLAHPDPAHTDLLPGQPPGWFTGVELCFAENLLRGDAERIALIAESEDEGPARCITLGEFRDLVARARVGLIERGIVAGDRIVGLLPNIPEAVIAMLAANSLGALWSSCSPDFGHEGIVDRFGQIAPRVLFTVDGYHYGGKHFSMGDRLEQLTAALPSLEHLVSIDYRGPRLEGLEKLCSWDEFLGPASSRLEFDRFAFDHALYLLYTSGTTGTPKCILHGAGGTLLKHLEEHALQCDIARDDRVFYFTTCGWMMWNWLVSALAREASIVLYDGNPVTPDAGRLLRLADRHGVTHFGTSPRYLSVLERSGLDPRREHRLAALRCVLSTGAPLHASQFEWVYAHFKKDVHLASISGGTDIVGCFVLGNPCAPVFAGEIQCRALGMDVASVNAAGERTIGEKGELICSGPFPSMPLGFWNDADASRYRKAYFERYPGSWHHGDWIELTERGSAIIHGRSDATLNPGGVRIGTAEIYRQVETLPECEDCIAVGHGSPSGGSDEQIWLFVVLADGIELDGELEQRIRRTIRTGTSPRHVPDEIRAVRAIPRTLSGKRVELAVAAALRAEEVTNLQALANPEALNEFREMARA